VREGKRPERTIYEITEEGSREMIDWMTELIGVPTKEYPLFTAGLSFLGALEPDEALQAFRMRAEALGFQLASIRGGRRAALDAGLPRLFALESEFEEQQMEAELHFVNALIKDIVSGDLDGLNLWRSFHADGPFEGVSLDTDPT
jgi:DNA-binding PadR family transcriptional regulator